MTNKVFIDTNILVYAIDASAGEKRKKAQRIVLDLWNKLERPYISTQVLSELHVTFLKRGLSAPQSQKIIKDYCQWQVVQIHEEIILAAIKEQINRKLSYWDSLILATAQSIKADLILSEDFQNNRLYGSVRVVNPLI
jgi:predicted nucleic acid-binding protein